MKEWEGKGRWGGGVEGVVDETVGRAMRWERGEGVWRGW